MANMFKLTTNQGASFEVIDTGGVCSVELDGTPITGISSGAQTITGVKTFSSGIAFGAGATLELDSANATTTGDDTTQSATVTKQAGKVTTAALTTAAGASTDIVLTLSGVVAGDLVFVSPAGGTNTKNVLVTGAVATTDTITITVQNIDAADPLDGTVALNYLWAKA
jgi:ammonia channel protein AmtB